MSYADLDYYKNTYKGTDPNDNDELQTALDRATDDINIQCNGPFTESDYASIQWEYLKKANCAQAEFYVLNGYSYNEPSDMPSASIGKFSYKTEKSEPLMAVRAQDYINASGMCNRAVGMGGQRGCDCGC